MKGSNETMYRRMCLTVLISVCIMVWSSAAEIVTSDLNACAPRSTQFTMPIENRQHFPSPKNDNEKELIFGVLLPKKTEKFGPLCALGATVAAIELAIRNSQQPGGLLEDYSITVAYIDTETSSTLAAFAAFQLYTKRPPGYYHHQKKKQKKSMQFALLSMHCYSSAIFFVFIDTQLNMALMTSMNHYLRRCIFRSVSRLFIGACHPLCWCVGYTGDYIRWFCRSI